MSKTVVEDHLRLMLDSTVEGLRYESPVLYKSLMEWKRLVLHTVYNVCRVTGEDEEAVLQDIVLALFEVSQVNGVPLYKWRRRLWEMRCVRGNLALLVSPRNNKNDIYRKVWAPVEEAVAVKKLAFSSMVFVKTKQTCADILSKHYTGKRGYSRLPEEESLVRVSSKRSGISYEKRMVQKVRQEVFQVDPCGNDPTCTDPVYRDYPDLASPDAEDETMVREAIAHIYRSSSKDSRRVLEYLLQNPGAERRDIAYDLDMCDGKVRKSYSFIRKSVHELVG